MFDFSWKNDIFHITTKQDPYHKAPYLLFTVEEDGIIVPLAYFHWTNFEQNEGAVRFFDEKPFDYIGYSEFSDSFVMFGNACKQLREWNGERIQLFGVKA